MKRLYLQMQLREVIIYHYAGRVNYILHSAPNCMKFGRQAGRGEGFKDVGEKGRLLVNCERFRLGGLGLKPGESYLVNVLFKPYKNTRMCVFDLIQNEVYDKRKKKIISGRRTLWI